MGRMPSFEVSARLLLDHAALRASAGELRCRLDASACTCGSSVACRCLSVFLDDFRRHLNRHFETEEREWSARNDPSWTSRARIDALILEHDDLRLRLARAVTSLEEAAALGRRPSGDLADEIRGILDDLLRHELSEAGLFQREVLDECSPVRQGRSRSESEAKETDDPRTEPTRSS